MANIMGKAGKGMKVDSKEYVRTAKQYVKRQAKAKKKVARAVTEYVKAKTTKVTKPAVKPKEQPKVEKQKSTEEFLGGVMSSIGKVPESGRFHGGKVYISEAHKIFVKDTKSKMSLDEFKRKLVDSPEGRANLSRADLVQAMPFDKVKASEASYLNGTYHFIRDPSRDPISGARR